MNFGGLQLIWDVILIMINMLSLMMMMMIAAAIIVIELTCNTKKKPRNNVSNIDTVSS